MAKADEKNTTAVNFEDSIEVVKQVTLPLWKQADDTTIYCRFDGEIFTGKELKGTGDNTKMEPAELAFVTNLETGVKCQMIVNAVLKGILEEEYEANENGVPSYVGKCFKIHRSKIEGKRYKGFTVTEIRLKSA